MNPKPSQNVKCKNPKCKCQRFEYIPVHGSYDFKCLCKHSYRDHNCKNKSCTKCACSCFDSTWSCSCGLKYNQHKTIIETYEERLASGKPMGEVARILMDPMVHGMQMGMGSAGGHGLESFSDMVDGAERFGTKIEVFEERRVSGYILR